MQFIFIQSPCTSIYFSISITDLFQFTYNKLSRYSRNKFMARFVFPVIKEVKLILITDASWIKYLLSVGFRVEERRGKGSRACNDQNCLKTTKVPRIHYKKRKRIIRELRLIPIFVFKLVNPLIFFKTEQTHQTFTKHHFDPLISLTYVELKFKLF